MSGKKRERAQYGVGAGDDDKLRSQDGAKPLSPDIIPVTTLHFTDQFLVGSCIESVL